MAPFTNKFQTSEFMNPLKVDSKIEIYQLFRKFWKHIVQINYFVYLEVFFKQQQQLFNVYKSKQKNQLRGGGICNSKNQTKPQKSLEITRRLQELIEINTQLNDQKKIISIRNNFYDDIVIYSCQTITIFLELFQQLEFPIQQYHETFKIFSDTINALRQNLDKELNTSWLQMFEFYFKLLQQALQNLEQYNNPKYQSNLQLLMRYNKQELNQNIWNELKILNSNFNQYETFYFYQIFQNKLVQMSNQNNFEISLITFFIDFIKNNDQFIQKNNYKIIIAALFILMNRLSLVEDQKNQITSFINNLLKIKYDDEIFIDFFLKQKDQGQLEIQKWLTIHLVILEQTLKNNKDIIDYINSSYQIIKGYQDDDFLQYLNNMRNRQDQKNIIKEKIIIVDDSQQVHQPKPIDYQQQLEIVRKNAIKDIQQQQIDETYVYPYLKIKSLIKIQQNLDEQILDELIFNPQQFTNLLEQKDQDIIWINGKIKSGKTTLAKKIINYLWEKSKGIPISIDLTKIEQMEDPQEQCFLKSPLSAKPFNFCDWQIQNFLNEEDKEKVYIFFDYYDQLSLDFKNKNIIEMLGYQTGNKNKKFFIISREQVKNLAAFKDYHQRIIEIEIKEFNEKQQKDYIELTMNKQILSNNININIRSIAQIININIDDGQILINQQEHYQQIEFSQNQQGQQFKKDLQKILLNLKQLNFLMQNTFVDCFSFHYQFKLLINLSLSLNPKSQQRQLQISQGQSIYQISNFKNLREKNFENRINSNYSSSISSSSQEKIDENLEPIDIDNIFDRNMFIKCISNPLFTKYEYLNSLVEQYIQDSIQEKNFACSKHSITKEKVLKFQMNMIIQEQQLLNNEQKNESNEQTLQIKTIKRLCLIQPIEKKILKSFFIAKVIYEEVIEFGKNNSTLPCYLNEVNLCKENYSGVVSLLQEQLSKTSNIRQILINLIKLSKDRQYHRSSSNSIYLSSILKLNLERENLDGIFISDITIHGLSLFQASLCDSYWENVDVSYCNFNQANLSNSKWNKITGIEEPQIITENGITQLQFKEKSNIIGILKSESISIWNINENLEIYNSNNSQIKRNLFDTYNYISFQRDQSIIAVSMVQNQQDQNNSINSQISIIDYDKDQLISKITNDHNCNSMCFLTSKAILCYVSSNSNLHFWNYEKNNIPKEIKNDFKITTKIATNNDDTKIVLLNDKNKIRLCNLKRRQDYTQYIELCKEINANNFYVSDCHKSLALLCSNQVKIQDWNFNEIKKFSMQSRDNEINSIQLNEDQNRVAQYKNNKISFYAIQFETNLQINIIDSEIQNAQYSPDGQNVVIQLQDKTLFYNYNKDTIFIEIEKVEHLVFSDEFFATSSNLGIKIYKFPNCELIGWLPFKAKQLIFNQKSQYLAIISEQIYIYDMKKIINPKLLDNKYINLKQESSFIIAVSANNQNMTIAQNGQILFYQDQKYQIGIQKQDEKILYMCFTKDNQYLAIRSKIGFQHIFRVINFYTQETIQEWTDDDQNENKEFSNQFEFLQIQDKIYVISNQNDRLILQAVTQLFGDKQENENQQKNQTIKLEPYDENSAILSMSQLCYNFSISHDQQLIASCFYQDINQSDNSSIIVIWKQGGESLYQQCYRFKSPANTMVNFSQYDYLLILTFMKQQQSMIQLICISDNTTYCTIPSQQAVQSIKYSSNPQNFIAMHSNYNFSLYKITESKQLELQLYCQQTEIPIYFTQTGLDVLYIFQQQIFISNAANLIYINEFYSTGIEQIIDQNTGFCYVDTITYFNNQDKKIVNFTNQINKEICYNNQPKMPVVSSQFSCDGQILLYIFQLQKQEQQQQILRILLKNENQYVQEEEHQFDSKIYSFKFLTNKSFIVISKQILIYEMFDLNSSFKKYIIELPNFLCDQQLKTINVHPNGKDFLIITNSGKLQLYRLYQKQIKNQNDNYNYEYNLYKTFSDKDQFEAKGCIITGLDASENIQNLLYLKGAKSENITT
ncbi:unnamed protein product [Paramecium primaurelia]|uniref:WD40-repeat-containing domain n=1 Tax=Paramecium primaurelia TaxID=5886 RepID=A0A8S1PU92_PARPR|nr:unnamed protein product [Paramecium primaurelia]